MTAQRTARGLAGASVLRPQEVASCKRTMAKPMMRLLFTGRLVRSSIIVGLSIADRAGEPVHLGQSRITHATADIGPAKGLHLAGKE